jgi:hypothetical protein
VTRRGATEVLRAPLSGAGYWHVVAGGVRTANHREPPRASAKKPADRGIGRRRRSVEYAADRRTCRRRNVRAIGGRGGGDLGPSSRRLGPTSIGSTTPTAGATSTASETLRWPETAQALRLLIPSRRLAPPPIGRNRRPRVTLSGNVPRAVNVAPAVPNRRRSMPDDRPGKICYGKSQPTTSIAPRLLRSSWLEHTAAQRRWSHSTTPSRSAIPGSPVGRLHRPGLLFYVTLRAPETLKISAAGVR